MRWPDLVRLLEMRMEEIKEMGAIYVYIFSTPRFFVGNKAVFCVCSTLY
jgi:hypothetical protein